MIFKSMLKYEKMKKIETFLAILSFALIGIIYFIIFPESYKTTSMNVHIYRPLIYIIFGFLLPIILFGLKGFAEKYGFRKEGLKKSLFIAAIAALPLFILGNKFAAGPSPSLLTWYFLNILEETYFRGLWQRIGEHIAGIAGAIIIPSILFGIYHLTAGFTPFQAIGPVFLGILFSSVQRNTNNIAGPILMHMAVITGIWFAAQ